LGTLSNLFNEINHLRRDTRENRCASQHRRRFDLALL